MQQPQSGKEISQYAFFLIYVRIAGHWHKDPVRVAFTWRYDFWRVQNPSSSPWKYKISGRIHMCCLSSFFI